MFAKIRNSRCSSLALVASLAMAFGAAERAEAAGRLASFRAAKAANLAAANVAATANLAALNPGCAPAPCCPAPCITYRHRGPKLCCGCAPSVETVLAVSNPCTCCPVQVPVCLPSCCCGEPTVCCHRGLVGRDVVSYQWCCGFRVDVRFLACGDIVVVTHGV